MKIRKPTQEATATRHFSALRRRLQDFVRHGRLGSSPKSDVGHHSGARF